MGYVAEIIRIIDEALVTSSEREVMGITEHINVLLDLRWEIAKENDVIIQVEPDTQPRDLPNPSQPAIHQRSATQPLP